MREEAAKMSCLLVNPFAAFIMPNPRDTTRNHVGGSPEMAALLNPCAALKSGHNHRRNNV